MNQWQTIVTICIVVVALIYTSRKLYRQLKGKDSPNCAFCNTSCHHVNEETKKNHDNSSADEQSSETE